MTNKEKFQDWPEFKPGDVVFAQHYGAIVATTIRYVTVYPNQSPVYFLGEPFPSFAGFVASEIGRTFKDAVEKFQAPKS